MGKFDDLINWFNRSKTPPPKRRVVKKFNPTYFYVRNDKTNKVEKHAFPKQLYNESDSKRARYMRAVRYAISNPTETNKFNRSAFLSGFTQHSINHPETDDGLANEVFGGYYPRALTKKDSLYNITINPNEGKTILVRDSKKGGVGFQTIYPNMIDSIGKYGRLAGVTPKEAFGLPFQETEFGRKLFTYNEGKYSDNENDIKLIKTIPAHNLVRDFEYINPFKDYQEPPLLHAYKKFKSGTYNLNDKNHTPDVRRKGEDLFSNEEFIKMWKNSKYYYE